MTPSVGRIVHIHNRPGAYRSSPPQPEVAIICFVHNQTLVNVAGFDCNGDPFKLSSLPILQEAAPNAKDVTGAPAYPFAIAPPRV